VAPTSSAAGIDLIGPYVGLRDPFSCNGLTIAQAGFGEAIGIIGGVQCNIHFFAFDLPLSYSRFVAACPAETT
jgi:hypothetical protein